MPISITWGSRVINVPQNYLTPLGGSIYELDLEVFREDILDIMDDEQGIAHPDTHIHNTEVSLGGITLARTIEFINGYTVTFEDGQYAVEAKGANSNIADVMNLNQVSLRTFNSAGLIVRIQGSGLSTEEHDKLMLTAEEDGGRLEVVDDNIVNVLSDTSFIKDIEGGKWQIIPGIPPQMVFYKADNVTEIARFNITYDGVNPIMRERI
jgi:hypothetical protein